MIRICHGLEQCTEDKAFAVRNVIFFLEGLNGRDFREILGKKVGRVPIFGAQREKTNCVKIKLYTSMSFDPF
jgi:hypothetical protein